MNQHPNVVGRLLWKYIHVDIIHISATSVPVHTHCGSNFKSPIGGVVLVVTDVAVVWMKYCSLRLLVANLTFSLFLRQTAN